MKMADVKRTIEETDNVNPSRADRELRLKEWDDNRAREAAAEEGIELSDEHWAVINRLRDFYRDNGPAESGRVLSEMLDTEFADKGGRRYLRRLFPEGPVGQGLRIAGLPVPAYTEDEGFGVSR
jgi:tRNA 2-thiouridine synthesizing protein E